MPIYEYKCECGQVYEEIRSIDDRNKPVKCKCGKEAKKAFSTANLTGFDEYGRSKG